VSTKREEPVNVEGSPAHRRRARPYLWPILIGVAVFLLGAVFGAGLSMVLWNKHYPPKHMLPPEGMAASIVERLTGELGLSAEQEGQMLEILTRHLEVIKGLRDESFKEMQGQFELMEAEVERILSEEQAQRWREHIEQLHERFRRPGDRHEREPGGPPPGSPEPGDQPPNGPEPGNPPPDQAGPGNPPPGNHEPGGPPPGNHQPGDTPPGDHEPESPPPGEP